MQIEKENKLGWFDVIGLTWALLAFVGTFLSFFGFFSGIGATLLASALAGICVWKFRSEFSFFSKPKILSLLIFALVIASIVIRLPPFPYLAGGQDEGIYTSLAKNIQLTGSYYLDTRVPSLPADLKAIYESLRAVPGLHRSKEFSYLGFYPAHPVLMAWAMDLFGDRSALLSLTIAAVLSMLALCKLVKTISNSRKLAFAFLLLIAVHPLHIFFAKFPVSELPALAFTSLFFYYLALYYKQTLAGRSRPILLVLAFITWTAFLYVRISSFLYIPFLYLLCILSLVPNGPGWKRRHIAIFFACLLISSLYSYYVYYHFTPVLGESTFKDIFGRLFGANWKACVALGSLLGLLLLLGVARFRDQSQKAIDRFFLPFAVPVYFCLFLTFLAFHSVLSFKNAKGDLIQGILNRYVTFEGWSLVGILNIWQDVVYFGPIGFIALLVVLLFLPKQRNSFLIFIGLFVSFFITMTVSNSPYSYGGFYYGRYHLSEIVPFGLVLIFCSSLLWRNSVRNSRISRIIADSILTVGYGLSLAYFTASSIACIKYYEGPEAKFYKRVAEKVGPRDLLIFDRSDPHFKSYHEIATALMFFYRLNAFAIPEYQYLSDPNIKRLLDQFEKVYLIRGAREEKPNLKYLDSFKFKFGLLHSGHGHLYLAWAHDEGVFNTYSPVEYGAFKPILDLAAPTLYSYYEHDYPLYEVSRSDL